MDVDVAVVGAGPAGAAAALAVLQQRPGASVVLLDRAAFPRDKVCGDGVAPHVLDLLRGLGEPDLLDDWPRVGRLSVGFSGGPAAAGPLHPAGLVVPREVLDARLVARAVARGATLVQHRVRTVQVRRRQGVLIDGDLRARVAVGADGAHSAVRRALAVPGNPPRATAVAIRGYAPARPSWADDQVLALDGSAWPAYAWSFPVGDGRANVGYGRVLRAGAAAPTREELLAGLDRLLPGAGCEGGRWRAHHLPLSSYRPRQPTGPVLLVGDAASLVNPLSGEGIVYAVASGALAGRAAAAALAGEVPDPGLAYARGLRRLLGGHLRDTSLLARATRGPALVRAAVRGAARDPRAFADLVELGLARGRLTPRVARAVARGWR